jgi:hypothetical protein
MSKTICPHCRKNLVPETRYVCADCEVEMAELEGSEGQEPAQPPKKPKFWQKPPSPIVAEYGAEDYHPPERRQHFPWRGVIFFSFLILALYFGSIFVGNSLHKKSPVYNAAAAVQKTVDGWTQWYQNKKRQLMDAIQ